LAGALLFDEAALFWFGLLTSHNPKNNLCLSRIFGARYSGKDHGEHMQTVIQKSRRLDSLLHEVAQNFELLSNNQDQK
jgi:hypothetical protein